MNFDNITIRFDEEYNFTILSEFDTLPTKTKMRPKGRFSSSGIYRSPNKLGLVYCPFCLNVIHWTDIGTINTIQFHSLKIDTDETLNEWLRLKELAITAAEESAMWAVKAATI